LTIILRLFLISPNGQHMGPLVRFITACTLATVSLAGCSGERRPDAAASQKPQAETPVTIPTFSGRDAFGYLLRQTSFGPRNPGSRGHKDCLDFMTSTLQGFADDVRLQQFAQAGYGGEVLRLTNIIASFRPEATARILLCAHWDTRPRAERDPDHSRRNQAILGANDGASGVAVLLEIASLLKKERPKIGVDLVFFDGEDYGMEGDQANYLLGSRHFAKNLPNRYLPRFGVLLDMVGDTNLELPKEMHSVRYAPDVVDLVWGKARELGLSQFLDSPGEEVLDDHVPLNEAGIKTIDLIDFNYPDQSNRYWHTHQDTPEHCSAESLEAVGMVLTHVLYTQRP
jgi:glutaminyl-peptide cyclotransferase